MWMLTLLVRAGQVVDCGWCVDDLIAAVMCSSLTGIGNNICLKTTVTVLFLRDADKLSRTRNSR